MGEQAQVSYVFPGDSRGTATSLLVTVNSPDDQFPPATYSLEIEEPSGTVTAPLPLEPERRYDIIVSAGDKDGVLTRAVRRRLAPV